MHTEKRCVNTHDDDKEEVSPLNLHAGVLGWIFRATCVLNYVQTKKASLVTEDESEHFYKY